MYVTFGLDAIDDRWGKTANTDVGTTAIETIINSLGVLVGFSWEHSFDGGVTAISHQAKGHEAGTQLLFAVLVVVVIVPSWSQHILPKTLMLADLKKSRKDYNANIDKRSSIACSMEDAGGTREDTGDAEAAATEVLLPDRNRRHKPAPAMWRRMNSSASMVSEAPVTRRPLIAYELASSYTSQERDLHVRSPEAWLDGGAFEATDSEPFRNGYGNCGLPWRQCFVICCLLCVPFLLLFLTVPGSAQISWSLLMCTGEALPSGSAQVRAACVGKFQDDIWAAPTIVAGAPFGDYINVVFGADRHPGHQLAS